MKTLVKMLQNYNSDETTFECGKSYTLDSETADKWIELGLAETADPNELLNEKQQEIADAQEKAITSIVETLAEKVKSQSDSTPQVVVKSPEYQKTFGDFAVQVAKAADPQFAPDAKKTLEEIYESKVLAGTSGQSGGYLVPTEFLNQVLAVAGESSFAKDRCMKLPMSSNKLDVPTLDQTVTPSGGSSAFYAGVVMNWTEDDTTPTETEPLFKDITLNAHELSGYTKVHSYLLNDSPASVDALLTQLFGGAWGQAVDYSILRGDGVGKPLGVISSGATVGCARATSSEINYADLAKMKSRLLRSGNGRAVWVFNSLVEEQILQMVDAGNNNIFMANASESIPGTIFGIPVYYTENAPALGSKGDGMLIDLGNYALGTRQDMTISTSEHVDFLRGRITYRIAGRLDGQPMISSPVTLADGSSQVSPFVVLNA